MCFGARALVLTKLLVPATLLLAMASQGQTATFTPTWVQQSPTTSPSARDSAITAYDAATKQVLLFGGSNNGGYVLADTWTYNGATWVQQSPSSSPSGRYWTAMDYDAATSQIVMFGGSTNTSQLGDTWTWNGTTWTQQSPSTSPSARYSATMAYDAATGQMLLFGGYGGSILSDTWTWNGTTWTQLNPSNSPPARYAATMSYDTATGQVVLFGGQGVSSLLSDTWTWNGTTWTQQNPSTSPSARVAATMVYDEAAGQVVLFGGQGSSSLLSDTWTWNGTTWTQLNTPNSPAARYYSTMAYDSATSQVVLFGGTGSGSDLNDTQTLQLGSVNLGTANVCSSGSPTPCSTSATLTFTFSGTSGTIKAPAVLTQGATGLDFTDAGTGTCTTQGTSHTYNSGDTCTVVVTFAPLAAGQRMGAVVISNSSGTPLATTFLSGVGTGPLPLYQSGVKSTYKAIGTNYENEMAIDAAGNIYYTTYNNGGGVYKIPAGGGSVVTLTSGTQVATGVAVDGAGNVFYNDVGTGKVYELVGGTGSPVVVASVASPEGLAVDAGGNLYVSSRSSNTVIKLLAGTFTVYTTYGSSLGSVYNSVVDSSGNVYVTDFAGGNIYKFNNDGTGQTKIVSGLSSQQPSGISVDAAGNLYVAFINVGYVEKFAAGTYTGTVLTGTTSKSFYVLIGNNGTLYVSDPSNSQIVAYTRSTANALTFSSTAVGATSSAQTVVFENDGNASATIASVAASTANFGYALGTCSSTLTAGSTCSLSATFTPQTVGSPLSASGIATDNSLNITGSTQTVAMSGVSTKGAATFGTMSFSPAATEPAGTSQAITISDTLTYGGVQPTGAVTFVLNGVTYTATCTSTGSPETCTYAVPAATIAALAANTYTVTAALAADSNYSAATGTSGTFSIYSQTLTSLSVTGYSSLVILKQAGTVLVTLLDQNGNVDKAFTGTVTLTSSDPKATLPSAYTFQSSDAGQHFFNVTLNTLGTQSITATSSSVSGSQTGILVGDAVWVLSNNGNQTKLNSQGGSLVAYTGAQATNSNYGALAFDGAGSVWTVRTATNALTFFNSIGNMPSTYTGGGLNAPNALAIDGAGSIWISNSTGNTVSEFNNAGTAISPNSGYAASDSLSAPSAIAVDKTGGIWVTSKTGNSVTHVLGAATPVVTPLATATTNSTLGTKP